MCSSGDDEDEKEVENNEEKEKKNVKLPEKKNITKKMCKLFEIPSI